jgi:hypothetical protein
LEEEREVQKFMKRTITKGTRKNYEAIMRRWVEYREILDPRSDPGMCLERIPDEEGKIGRILHFYSWLYQRGYRAGEITSHTTALRDWLRIKRYKYDWLDDMRLIEARNKAGARTTEEQRVVHAKQRENTKLPVPLEVYPRAREKYWSNAMMGTGGLLDKALWLGMAIAVNDGRRLSNVMRPDGKNAEDHTIRRSDIALRYKETWYKPSQLREFLKHHHEDEIEEIVFIYETGKTSRVMGGNAPDEVFWGRDTPLESQVLSDLVVFLATALPEGYDEARAPKTLYLLTRMHRNKLKTPTQKEIIEALRNVVAEFGLDPDLFSGKSFRSGLATHGAAEGASKADIRRRGGWGEKSTVNERFYERNMGTARGALAIGNPDPSGNRLNVTTLRRVQDRIRGLFGN